jgi:exonuclease III
MHWNAEGLYNKKAELEHILHERNIQICCIQETHLQEPKSFKVRGYQCFRCDRKGRSKGGILTLTELYPWTLLIQRTPILLVVGDFNSHSQSWGYYHMDRRGEEVDLIG